MGSAGSRRFFYAFAIKAAADRDTAINTISKRFCQMASANPGTKASSKATELAMYRE